MKPVIIQLSGRQGSGKTTLARTLISQHSKTPHDVMFAYADPLYEMHDSVLTVAEKYGIAKVKKDRVLLQTLGTEWMRKTRDINAWVKIMQFRVRGALQAGAEMVVVHDCRFKNEYHAFDEFDYPHRLVQVRLSAPVEVRKDRAESWAGTDHPSEVDLDDYHGAMFDMVFETSTQTPEQIAISLMEGMKGLAWWKKGKS